MPTAVFIRQEERGLVISCQPPVSVVGKNEVWPKWLLNSELQRRDTAKCVAPKIEVALCRVLKRENAATVYLGVCEHVRSYRATVGTYDVGEEVGLLVTLDALEDLDLLLAEQADSINTSISALLPSRMR